MNAKNNYKKDFNKDLIRDGNINKFIFLLRKGVYPYEYMDSWERYDETSLPNKKAFYSSLNLENIKDADYRHAKGVFKIFNNKNIG